MDPYLSLILPAYNEARVIPTTLGEAKDDFLNRRKGQKRKSGRSLTFSGTRFRVPPPA